MKQEPTKLKPTVYFPPRPPAPSASTNIKMADRKV